MNFISKNLGWILLFLFFLFMLFIISTNQKTQDPASISGSINQEVDEATDDKKTQELDSLLDKLTETEEGNAESEEGTEDASGEESDDSSSFFDFFKKPKANNEDQETQSGSISGDEASAVKGSDTGAGLVKNTGKTTITGGSANKSRTTIGATNLPGLNLETHVGKLYAIGVHSLKLNNKDFNRIIGFVSRGDIVEQFTVEDERGCFQVGVLQSSRKNNEGKVGYVCKKYLQDISSGDVAEATSDSTLPASSSATTEATAQDSSNSNDADISNDDTSNSTKDSTESSQDDSYYTPNADTHLQDKGFLQNLVSVKEGDILKQIGAEDENGCFEVKVVGTNTPSCASLGMEGYVCKGQVSGYTIK